MEILRKQLINEIKSSGKTYYKNLEEKSIQELREYTEQIKETKRINYAWEKIMAGEVEEYGWGIKDEEDIGTYFTLREEY